MKLYFKQYLQACTVFWILFFFAYLCNVFIQFEFYNPFYWVYDIPYDINSRKSFLWLFFMIELFKILSVFVRNQ